MDDRQGPSYPLFAAIYDPAMAVVERTLLRPHRSYLVDDIHGAVLDIGAGTGAMFPYFDAVADGNVSFHAIEPDPHMRRQASEKAVELELEIDLRAAGAESLPYEDDSFDVVIASMVFCTIPDIEAALSEVARVLRPGGEFRFFEHVLDDGWRARVQSLLAPVWKRVAGGCHLTRQTASVFAADRSFDVVELDRMNLGVTPIRPFVRGRLRKRT
ncbi:class I SAM-dependent methyltransferase [Halosimplex rubrum]|uniref:Class I SAM-dependent methyltransferase n=1 Tax=Halosimplex rubrum TaxID=869889 RepID=A0A7D5TMH7_9EURY|nr:class I SAM-dependent methyltransferase [Halosimplex rubrum]QLH76634.1 class I SAM-dependent methyltransferase [Halosimplex rubrum]